MNKVIFFIVGTILILLAGISAIFLGARLANSFNGDGTLKLLMAFALTSTLSWLAIRKYMVSAQEKSKNIFLLYIPCFVVGLVYDLIHIPEGFKFIAIFIILLGVSVFVRKRLKHN